MTDTTALRAIAERATKGTWVADGRSIGPASDCGSSVCLLCEFDQWGNVGDADNAAANGELIVAAVNALPALLDHIDAQARALEEARATLEQAEAALSSVDTGVFRTYRTGNNRQKSIEADDGEACDIMHSDITTECRAALVSVRAASQSLARQEGVEG